MNGLYKILIRISAALRSAMLKVLISWEAGFDRLLSKLHTSFMVKCLDVVLHVSLSLSLSCVYK